jgi:hypothetical protein
MQNSPYHGKDVAEWDAVTDELIAKHPLVSEKIVEITLKSWNDIFTSKIGSLSIGNEIYPAPQIMSFLLHELVAYHLSKEFPKVYKVGREKGEKDIHCITDDSLSVEIKGSTHLTQIFANRSYAQPDTGKGSKSKNGYYIAINFGKFSLTGRPEIAQISFGYLEHTDWIPQASATGQQARLSANAYAHKLRVIYRAKKTKDGKLFE